MKFSDTCVNPIGSCYCHIDSNFSNAYCSQGASSFLRELLTSDPPRAFESKGRRSNRCGKVVYRLKKVLLILE